MLGDANGDKLVTTLDAVAILKHVVGNEIISDASLLKGADANEDGNVTTLDAVTILKYIVGNGSLGKQ